MVKDLNPLTTPNTVLTDCLNGTLITYNGNEYVLQNDMGNCKVERARLSPGFIPMGMKEYGGIIYIASYNPDTKECEVGSFPSPERDITGSVKIGSQTGLQDGNFSSSDYSIPTSRAGLFGNFSPEEITSKIQKLNEPEVLKLSPGDKYITTYQLSGDISNFSSNPNDKKIFTINFYKIDEDNSVKLLPYNEVKTIQHRNDISEDEYVYYTENSRGSIAVEIALNTISYFNAAAREISRQRDSEKEIRIEAYGETESLVDFKGVRVDVEAEKSGSTTFHINKTGSDSKISAGLKELQDEETVKLEVTPFTQYGYLPSLKQSFTLKMGQGPSGDNVNDIFKWNVNVPNSKLELDFDFKLEIDSDFKLFLEFYDPWSNVSTIRTVHSPSQYGSMRMIIDLKDEPKTDIFDTYPVNGSVTDLNLQMGGIKLSNLNISNSITQQPILVNPSVSNGVALIRNDNALRKNHFYIVRLCGYEEVTEGDQVVRKVYDVYRMLYTNTAYNEIYAEQATVSIENPLYTPNFNKIPYPLEKIKYDISLGDAAAPSVITKPVEQVTEEVPMTNGKMFSIIEEPSDETITFNTEYEVIREYPVNIGLQKEFIYGELKKDLMTVTAVGDDPDDDLKWNIPAESIIDNTPEDMLTEGYVSLPDLLDDTTPNKLKLYVKTNRPIHGIWDYESITGKTVRVFLNELLYKNNSNTTRSICGDPTQATHAFLRAKRQNNNYSKHCEYVEGGRYGYAIALQLIDMTQTYDWSNQSFRIIEAEKDETNGSLITSIPILNNGEASTKNFFLTYVSGYSTLASRQYRQVLTVVARVSPAISDRIVLFELTGPGSNGVIQMSRVNNFLKDFYYDKYVSGDRSDNYFITNWTSYDENNGITELKDLNVEFKSKWEASSKSYIFESITRGLGQSDLNTFDVNTVSLLISQAKARATDNEVLEDEIEDNGFIPFVDSNTTIEFVDLLNLFDEKLVLKSDSNIVKLMEKSRDDFSKYYDANKPDPNKLGTIKHINESLMNENQKAFLNCLYYDPGTSYNGILLSAETPLRETMYMKNGATVDKTKVALPPVSTLKIHIN